MKLYLIISSFILFTGCNSITLQGLIDENLDTNSSYDYNSSNKKKLDEMPAIGKLPCKSLTCRKK